MLMMRIPYPILILPNILAVIKKTTHSIYMTDKIYKDNESLKEKKMRK